MYIVICSCLKDNEEKITKIIDSLGTNSHEYQDIEEFNLALYDNIGTEILFMLLKSKTNKSVYVLHTTTHLFSDYGNFE